MFDFPSILDSIFGVVSSKNDFSSNPHFLSPSTSRTSHFSESPARLDNVPRQPGFQRSTTRVCCDCLGRYFKRQLSSSEKILAATVMPHHLCTRPLSRRQVKLWGPPLENRKFSHPLSTSLVKSLSFSLYNSMEPSTLEHYRSSPPP